MNEIITQLKERLEKRVVRVIGERLDYGREPKINVYEKKLDFLRMAAS